MSHVGSQTTRMQKPGTTSQKRLLCIALLFWLLACCSQIETLLIEPRSDSAAWLYMGARQAHGQMPGRDLWDNKLPLIYLMGRAAMALGCPRLFLWLTEAGLTAVAATAVLVLLRRVDKSALPASDPARSFRTPALAAGLLLCIVAGAPSFHAGGFKTEIYAMPLSVLALVLSLLSIQRGGRFWMGAAAGGCWTLAVSFRLPVAIVALAAVVYIAATCRGPRWWAWMAAHITGLVVGGFLVLLHPLLAGYLRECIAASVLWPAGLNGEHIPGPLSISTGRRFAEVGQDLLKLGWLYVPAVCGLVLAWRRGEKAFVGLVGLWLIAALASAASGWASYAHYLYISFAPACLACGLLIGHASSLQSRWWALGLLGLAALVVGFQNIKEIVRYGPGKIDPDRIATRQFLLRETEPTDGVFIWAWNRSAPLLYEIDRPPGTRHFLAHTYFNMDMGLSAEMVAEFEAEMPRWIVEDTWRNRPPLIGSPNPAQFVPPPASLARLQQLVNQNYDSVASYGHFTVLKRRCADPHQPG